MDNTRDKRWSNEVKKYYKDRCPHCLKNECSSHHIIGRGNIRTRYIRENGIYCCNKLHRDFENPLESKIMINKYIGENVYLCLESIAIGKNKPEDFGFEIIK